LKLGYKGKVKQTDIQVIGIQSNILLPADNMPETVRWKLVWRVIFC